MDKNTEKTNNVSNDKQVTTNNTVNNESNTTNVGASNTELPKENTNQATTTQAAQVQQPVSAEQTAQPPQPVATQQQTSSAQPAQVEQPAQVVKNPTSAFNTDEKVVYEIKPEKDANPIGVILFLAIIIGFALNLPTISKYVNKYLHPVSVHPISTNTTPENNEKPDENEKKEEQFYKFDLGFSSATIGNLSLKNLMKNNNNNHYELTFTLLNESEETYNYDKKYFIEFYEDERFISDSLIHSFEPLTAKSSRQFSVPITAKAYENSNQFKLVEKSSDDYPEKELTDIEGEYSLLKCSFENDNITYYFKDNLLEKIANDYGNGKEVTNYETLLQEAKTKSNNINNIEGIDSTLIESPTAGYTVKSNYDLKTIKGSDLTFLKDYKLFRYHEKLKIVSYEITSLGYTCS